MNISTKIELVVRIVIGAVELLKNNFEIKEEVKTFFLGTDYYLGAIRNEMMERGVLSEYLGLFDCADPQLIFDRYVTVDENSLAFDYAEAKEGNDRAKCYFKVSCEFDVLRYLNAMVRLNRETDNEDKDSSERPASDINGFMLIDDTSFQYGRKLYEEDGEERWAFVEMLCIGEEKYRVHADALMISSYDEEHIARCVKGYYAGGVAEVRERYPESWQQIILECVFETDWDGYDQIAEEDVSSETEAYKTIKRWLSDEGVVSGYCRTAIQVHENSAKKEKPESESKGEVLHITVYRDTVEPELHGDDNLTELEVSKPLFMEYFRERILPSFKGDDDTVSEEGMLQEWLDEYTADDTTDLYDFIQSEEKKAKDREYYQKLYDEKYDKLLEEARNKGCPDPESEANEAFNECATAEEVVGYYIVWHGDDAFKDWIENSQFYERERGEVPSELDRAVTRILGELYDNTVVKGIEWYIPEGTSVNPKLSEVKVIPKVTGRTEKECTEAVRLYLQLTYATEPKAFSFMLPDGRMAGYRNWELSSTTKKNDDVGCYGAGSTPCLNGCAGCDRLKRELKFETRNAMEEYLKCGDAYNPITETFVSQYNDKGHIVVYTGIDVMRARQLAEETRRAGEESWISVIGPGGAIYEKDFPFDSAADSWMRDNFSKDGWVVADTDTFSNENKIFIHHAWDFDPVDWIVGISGSDMDDVIVKVITGTTDAVKRHLLMEVQNIRADGEDDDWDSGAETVDDINVHDDGKLYACACFRDCHFDLTATPMSNVQHIMPFN